MTAHLVGQNDNEDFHTDKVDDANYQFNKLVDGRVDGEEPLAVSAAGAIGTQVPIFTGRALAGPGLTSYAAGEVIGGAMEVGTLPGGVWRLSGITAGFFETVTPAFVTPFPNVMFAFVALPEAVDASAIFTDGYDAFTAPTSMVPSIQIVELSDMPASPLSAAVRHGFGLNKLIIAAGAGGVMYDSLCKLWLMVVANDTISDFTTPQHSFGSTVALEFLGDGSIG